MTDFEKEAAKIAGLHFSQEVLASGEREIFYLAEHMMQRVRAVLDLHVPDTTGWKVGTPVSYMFCKGCRIKTMSGGIERRFDDCPTRAAILALT